MRFLNFGSEESARRFFTRRARAAAQKWDNEKKRAHRKKKAVSALHFYKVLILQIFIKPVCPEANVNKHLTVSAILSTLCA